VARKCVRTAWAPIQGAGSARLNYSTKPEVTMTRVIQIRKWENTPTAITIFINGKVVRDFVPSREWLVGMRRHLSWSNNWRFVPLFWVSEKVLEIEFEYTGGKNND